MNVDVDGWMDADVDGWIQLQMDGSRCKWMVAYPNFPNKSHT